MIISSIQDRDLAKLIVIFSFPIVNDSGVDHCIPEWLIDLILALGFIEEKSL